MISRLVTILFSSVILVSCNTNINNAAAEKETGAGTAGYFSVKQFIKDQWDTYHGQPFGLRKTIYLDGKIDSSEISAYDMDWGTIFKTFFE